MSHIFAGTTNNYIDLKPYFYGGRPKVKFPTETRNLGRYFLSLVIGIGGTYSYDFSPFIS